MYIIHVHVYTSNNVLPDSNYNHLHPSPPPPPPPPPPPLSLIG